MSSITKEASQKRKWSIGPASSGLDLFIQERCVILCNKMPLTSSSSPNGSTVPEHQSD